MNGLIDIDPVSLTAALDIPGVIDVHTHFMPEPVMRKVWQFFDNAETAYGTRWPIEYRQDQSIRLRLLRDWGVKAFTSLVYAHKPGMAEWLNQWTAQFSAQVPDCLQTATFYPESGVSEYVAAAVSSGARLFKVHIQVGEFDPGADELRPAWGMLQETGTPVLIHCGSGPIAGRFTGPEPLRKLLGSFPRLTLIVAHLGSPEYADFLEIAATYPGVKLDTTMAFTDFMEELAPFPQRLRPALSAAGLRGDVIFGSDFPNIPYRYGQALAALERLDLGPDWLRAVVWDSAQELFFSRRGW